MDLADLASRAATRLAPQFQDARVTLIVNADTVLPVHVDPDRITQVLTNLLGNALLATPAGGTVAVTARRTARGGEVVVTDTGVGLAEQDVERVYRAPGQPRGYDAMRVPGVRSGRTRRRGLISNGTLTTDDYSLIDPGSTTATPASFTSTTATVVPATFTLTASPPLSTQGPRIVHTHARTSNLIPGQARGLM